MELECDDSENVLIIDGNTISCYFADGSSDPITETPYTLAWFSNDFSLILHYKVLLDEWLK